VSGFSPRGCLSKRTTTSCPGFIEGFQKQSPVAVQSVLFGGRSQVPPVAARKESFVQPSALQAFSLASPARWLVTAIGGRSPAPYSMCQGSFGTVQRHP